MTALDHFNGKAKGYAMFRPSYPRDLYNHLYERLKIAKDNVLADIGSGTGLFSLELLSRGNKVYCIDPCQDMRLEAERLLGAMDGFVSVAASAEETTLPDASVDLVVAAQAFHWFDRDRFHAECRRILKPDGKVVLIWYSRDESTELVQKLIEINRSFCPDFSGFSGNSTPSNAGAFKSFFKGGIFEKYTQSMQYYTTEEAFIGLALSSSYAPCSGHAAYEPYQQALRALFQANQTDQHLAIPYCVYCYYGRP